MPRRRRRPQAPSGPPPGAWFALVVAVAVVAVGVGIGFSIAPRRPAVEHGRISAPTPPAGPPVAPTPLVTAVPVELLDAAVRQATAPIGTLAVTAQQQRTAVHDGRHYEWIQQTAEVRLRPGFSTEEAVARLVKEVERAGGRVISQSASGVRLGLRAGNLWLVTHELRFVASRASAPIPAVGPRVAIIFDDAGGSLADLEAIVALGRPVAVSILPGLRFSKEVALRAQAAGLEVMLHLPLEAEDSSKELGPGGITTAMSEEVIDAMVRADLASVPGALGVNNHMGSRGTADGRVMRAVLQVIRERGLLFVDSLTTPRSVAGRLATEMRIKTASRQVFLDNENAPEPIREQILLLLAVARRRGEAVAIGHAQRMTARVLLGMLDEFDRAGVAIVPISAIVR